MIEPMTRITLVALRKDRKAALEALRDMEIMHVRLSTEETTEYTESLRNLEELKSIIRSIEAYRATEGESVDPGGYAEDSSAELADKAKQLLDRLSTLREKKKELDRELSELAPWGDFDPASIHKLRDKGLHIHLCVSTPSQIPNLGEGVVVSVISQTKELAHYAVISQNPLKDELPEIRLPDKSVKAIRAESEQIGQEIENLESELRKIAVLNHKLDEAMIAQQDTSDFIKVRDSMGITDALVYLNGYIPKAREAELKEIAKKAGWALHLQEPDEEDKAVPTLIRYPTWVQPIKAMFDLIGVSPGYREVDVSSLFLFFFSFFFAIIIGDAAYGAIILGLTLYAWSKFKTAPKEPFVLMTIMSIVTIIWGVLTGVYFGIELNPDSPLNSLIIKNLQDPKYFQMVCFFIGAVHLTLAHLWNFFVYIKSLKCLNQLSWIAILWGNFFLARTLVLGYEAPDWILYPYIYGGIGVFLFAEPSRNIGKMVGGGLLDVFMNGVSSFVDLISYIRLFAVSSAALALEISFNNMAMEMGWNSVVAGAVAALILVLGHGLNIVLSLLSVVVHGVRLNVLEFSGHVGLEWSGVVFKPFKKLLKSEIS